MDGGGVPRALRPEFAEHFTQSKNPGSQKVIRLYLIRHGESENNVLAKTLEDALMNNRLSREEALERWFAERSDDPDLSVAGAKQVVSFASVFATEISRKGGAALACSPMLRALKTMQPLAERLGERVTVLPEIFETGGCFRYTPNAGHVAGRALSATDIERRFRGFDASRLPRVGPWHGGAGRERHADAMVRARRAAEWLLSPAAWEMASERCVGGDSSKASDAGAGSGDDNRGAEARLAIVSHGDFMDMLIKALLSLHHQRRSATCQAPPELPVEILPENLSVVDLALPLLPTATAPRPALRIRAAGGSGSMSAAGGLAAAAARL